MATNESSPRPNRSTPEQQSRSLNERLIAERITTLLSHFWTSADAPELRALQLGDWLDDLSEFSATTVAAATQEWRRSQSRRPTPADIRALCVSSTPNERELTYYAPSNLEAEAKLRRDRYRQWDEAETAREQWARDCGCESFAHAMKIGLAVVEEREIRKAAAAKQRATGKVEAPTNQPFVLPSEDDPKVQEYMRRMGEAS